MWWYKYPPAAASFRLAGLSHARYGHGKSQLPGLNLKADAIIYLNSETHVSIRLSIMEVINQSNLAGGSTYVHCLLKAFVTFIRYLQTLCPFYLQIWARPIYIKKIFFFLCFQTFYYYDCWWCVMTNSKTCIIEAYLLRSIIQTDFIFHWIGLYRSLFRNQMGVGGESLIHWGEGIYHPHGAQSN